MNRTHSRMAAAAALVAAALLGTAHAQAPAASADDKAYPNRAVTIILPASPGSNPDTATRLLAKHLSARMGQSFVIDPRVGAGGSIAMRALARAPADGYTLSMSGIGPLSINPFVYSKLPYDARKDFVPVTLVYKSPLLLGVPENSPYRTFAELIAAAKASPGTLTFSSPGNASAGHLGGEYFKELAGAPITHIPYGNAAASTVAVASGEVNMVFGSQSLIWPLVRGKKIRVLGMSSDTRQAEFPEVPALSETVPQFEVTEWSGIIAPAGTPPAIVAKLQKEISAVLAMPEVVSQLRSQGIYPQQTTQAEFVRFIDAETEKWGSVARKIGLKLD